MKKLILASIIALGAWGITLIPTPASAGNCDGVRCMACPPGTVFSPTPAIIAAAASRFRRDPKNLSNAPPRVRGFHSLALFSTAGLPRSREQAAVFFNFEFCQGTG